MNKYVISFVLNDQERIVIQAEDCLENIYYNYYVPTVFISGSCEYKLSRYNPKYIAESLSQGLKKVLEAQEDLLKAIANKSEKEERVKLWLGEPEGSDEDLLVPWIYNDQDGHIVLEITSVESIRDSKPLIRTIIPVETAHRWLEQAEALVKKIDENMERFKKSSDSRPYSVDIQFPLNVQDTMTLELPDSLHAIICCNRGTIVFCLDTIHYKFGISGIEDHMQSLSEMLGKAMEGNFELHPSMTQDIGYLWNEAYREKPGFVYEGEEDEVKLWVGHKFRIWCSGEIGKQSLSVWIYNDQRGAIALEITPDYPWHDCDPTEYKDYIPYEAWIETYRPIAIKTISIEVARKWAQQANYIAMRINKNIDCMQAECAVDI